MAAATLHGQSVNMIVGGGDPRQAGEVIVRVLTEVGLLRPGLRILDLGCGCGRAAVALAEALAGRCDYVGLDIVPGLISFCREEVSSRYPNFSFYALEGANPHYDRYIDARQQHLLVPATVSLDGSFDLALAFSLFTHLRRRDALESLRAVHRFTKAGGSAVLSSFLLDRCSRRQICRGRTPVFGKLRSRVWARAGTRVLVEGDNAAVAYDQALFSAMVCGSGFDGIYSIHAGEWRCLKGLYFQDVVVLKKEAPFPPDFDPSGYLEANPDIARDGGNPFFHYRQYGRHEGRHWRP